MRVAVSAEQRFSRLPDGTVWTNSSFSHSFWTRYLDAFEDIRIVARVQDVRSLTGKWLRVDGDKVEMAALPYYVGPLQFLRQRRSTIHALEHWLSSSDAIILRVASTLANFSMPYLRRTGRPFALEVVCDPWDVFAPGAIKHPLRAFFRRWFTHHLKKQCQTATAVSYVTRETLQDRYSTRHGAFSTHYSSISLPESLFILGQKRLREMEESKKAAGNRVQRIITVGSLAQPYKGVDVLIRAIQLCHQRGLAVELVIIGDGKFRQELEDLVVHCGVNTKVKFLGELPGNEAVAAQLALAQLFVLASRTEGLPRAMIEAMACALPCVGTSVGGIPELISAEYRVKANDPAALAEKIEYVLQNQFKTTEMSKANYNTACEYAEAVIRKRRCKFYNYVREASKPHRASTKFVVGPTT